MTPQNGSYLLLADVDCFLLHIKEIVNWFSKNDSAPLHCLPYQANTKILVFMDPIIKHGMLHFHSVQFRVS